MKIRTNNNNNDLWCVYSKQPIYIGERYVEVIENCLDEDITKTYKYMYLDMLVDDYMDETGKDIIIEEE